MCADDLIANDKQDGHARCQPVVDSRASKSRLQGVQGRAQAKNQAHLKQDSVCGVAMTVVEKVRIGVNPRKTDCQQRQDSKDKEAESQNVQFCPVRVPDYAQEIESCDSKLNHRES